MNDMSAGGANPTKGGRDGPPRTIQQLIDETPRWADGTAVGGAPMTRMQWFIWLLAASGKFFEGMVVFMTGVALPLIGKQFGLGEFEHGVIAASALFGILVGATMLGSLSDTVGRKKMFVIEMAIFTVFLFAACFSPNFYILSICLFGLGVALGCDYPTAHMVISESIPSRTRGRLVLSAFGFQALGALTGTAVGYFILANHPSLDAWRWMYGVAVIPAAIVMIARLYVTESVHWLVDQGQIDKAEREAHRLLRRNPPYPSVINLVARQEAHSSPAEKKKSKGFRALFKRKHRRATILASVPWFLQDLGTYGIGIFTPIILATAVGHKKEHATSVSDIIHNDMLAARGAAVIDILLIVGIICAILLADKAGRMRLQMIGFIGCAAGLAIAAVSTFTDGTLQIVLVFAGFMLFNFMTNVGPNAQTYLIAGEVFPTRVRGKGAGLAASVGKIGAVTAALLFPLLLDQIGVFAVLMGLVVVSLLGALVTWRYRIETAGQSLEELHHHAIEHPLHSTYAKPKKAAAAE